MEVTIYLTNCAPVIITDENWPIILKYQELDINVKIKKPILYVRRHTKTLNHLVYGRGYDCKGGYLLNALENVALQIRVLCSELGIEHSFANECIQHLPPERLLWD